MANDESPSVLRRIDNFVRGVANGVTFGLADKGAAYLDSLYNGKNFDENNRIQNEWTAASAKDPAYHAGIIAGVAAPILATGGAGAPLEAGASASAKLAADVARLGETASANSFRAGGINAKMEALENAADAGSAGNIEAWSALGKDLRKVGADTISPYALETATKSALNDAAKAAADAVRRTTQKEAGVALVSGATAEFMAAPGNKDKTPSR